jgi:hypothetical protein
VTLNPLGTSATNGLLYQPKTIDDDDDDEREEVGGMRIGRGNRSTQRKPAPVPLCPPQIPYDLTWARIRAAAVGSRRLTAWAMVRPGSHLTYESRVSKAHNSSRYCLFTTFQVRCNVLRWPRIGNTTKSRYDNRLQGPVTHLPDLRVESTEGDASAQVNLLHFGLLR